MRRLLLALVVSSCAQVDNPFIGDDGGSGGGGAGAMGGGSGATGGGSGATGGGSGATGGGTSAMGGGSGGGCTEDWTCSGWQYADAGVATRSCVDTMQCGTTTNKPSEGPANVPALDPSYYRCKVQPIFDATCSMIGCHGVDTGRDFRVYSRGRWRHSETVQNAPTCLNPGGQSNLQMEGTGTIMCLGWSRLTRNEWQLNADNARLFAVGLATTADSLLLKEPLTNSGMAHDNIKVFTGTDARYATVKAWLDGATAPATCDGGQN
jgi:hypothetical protein